MQLRVEVPGDCEEGGPLRLDLDPAADHVEELRDPLAVHERRQVDGHEDAVDFVHLGAHRDDVLASENRSNLCPDGFRQHDCGEATADAGLPLGVHEVHAVAFHMLHSNGWSVLCERHEVALSGALDPVDEVIHFPFRHIPRGDSELLAVCGVVGVVCSSVMVGVLPVLIVIGVLLHALGVDLL